MLQALENYFWRFLGDFCHTSIPECDPVLILVALVGGVSIGLAVYVGSKTKKRAKKTLAQRFSMGLYHIFDSMLSGKLLYLQQGDCHDCFFVLSLNAVARLISIRQNDDKNQHGLSHLRRPGFQATASTRFQCL